jgi:putative DNA methylase
LSNIPRGQVNPRNDTLLDKGALPVEDLAKLAQRESKRPRQIYQVHRWFARRFGSAFRALLVAAALPDGSDFWSGYYNGVSLYGYTILDPFVGGGTSLVEARRLGADVIGFDIDSVACAITQFETQISTIPKLNNALDILKHEVGSQLAPYYRTKDREGNIRDVLHYFWVQIIYCVHCGEIIEAHPHYQLAYEAEGTKQWVFCPNCHEVYELNRSETHFYCKNCSLEVSIQNGPIKFGKLTCPYCNYKEHLINVAARTGIPPQWRLFALEALELSLGKKRRSMKQRSFYPVTEYDKSLIERTSLDLKKRIGPSDFLEWIPSRYIPKENRSDYRLLKYGYSYYHELFNNRQLLHLSLLAEAIDKLDEPVRKAMVIAFSDHLTTNCMMASYAFGWRRLAPLFSIRAYRHITRPVEINPWLDGIGRGTFPNAVHQIQRAIDWSHSPKEPLLQGDFCQVKDYISISETDNKPIAKIIHRNSQDLNVIETESVDLILTDPPYFDNISYSELSDFFLPWLQEFNLIPMDIKSNLGFNENLSANSRDQPSFEKYQKSIAKCFLELERVLKPEGRVIFTYQHQTAGAWKAIASAIYDTKLTPIQVFPLLGDSGSGLHKHSGSSRWDAVFVLSKAEYRPSSRLELSREVIKAACNHYQKWVQRLGDNLPGCFGFADKRNFYRACIISGALGMFPDSGNYNKESELNDLLNNIPSFITR